MSPSCCHFSGGPPVRKPTNLIADKVVPRGSSEKRHLFGLALVVLLCMGSLNKCNLRAGAKESSEGTPRYT